MATVPETESNNAADDRTKAPFLRRVRIEGYKSIAFCDVELQPLTILVGRNGAGKSNFLDALCFVRDLLTYGLKEALERHHGWGSISCRCANTRRIRFALEAEYKCGPASRRAVISQTVNGAQIPDLAGLTYLARYELEINEGTSTVPGPGIQHEALTLTHSESGSALMFETTENGLKINESPETRILRQLPSLLAVDPADESVLNAIAFQPFVDFRDNLRNLAFYNFHPELIRQLQSPLRGRLLKHDGRNLVNTIASLNEVSPQTLDRAREYLATIVEGVTHFDTVNRGAYETIEFTLRWRPEDEPLKFDAASMSDGTLRALASLIAAFQIVLPDGPSVVGIEEPETALHPAASRALVDALQEATERTQILLTTQSADLLADEELDPSQILVVRNRSGQTQITPVDAASRDIIHKKLYTLADLQRMDQLELDEEDLQRQRRIQSNNAEG